jgi:hypothetical protein
LLAGALNYAKGGAKDCIKFLIRRKVARRDDSVFFRLYLLHITGIKPLGLTCKGLHGEGAGSQALTRIGALHFANIFGLTYIHTPFAEIAHADRPMQEWAAAWEEHFGFGIGEGMAQSYSCNIVDYAINYGHLNSTLMRYRLYKSPEFETILGKVRNKYYCHGSPRKNDLLTVSIHVRRGDVSDSKNSYMWTSNSWIARIAVQLKAILDSKSIPYRLHIFSQGDISEFTELQDLGGIFFLDSDPIWTMQELIEADILIMAKSAFSYVAGLISDGIKLGEPYEHHPQLSHWITIGPKGECDWIEFERQLLEQVAGNLVVAEQCTAGSGATAFSG